MPSKLCNSFCAACLRAVASIVRLFAPISLPVHDLTIVSLDLVVGFGRNYKTLFRESRDYNDQTLDEATHHVEGMSADMGGTEILTPLSDLLKDHCDPEYAKQVSSNPGTSRPYDLILPSSNQIFVLTDGEVRNTGAVIQLIRDRYGTSSSFSHARRILSDMISCLWARIQTA